jgi:hypothetical protein
MFTEKKDIASTGKSFQLHYLNDNKGGGHATYISCVC